jgi:hypothetical protein
MGRDYYSILGVAKTAEADELKKCTLCTAEAQWGGVHACADG